MADARFRVLYSDIGGVLGTNGWDTDIRHNVCGKFSLPPDEIDKRHQLMFDSYERGFMTFEHYLRWVFFAAPRAFSLQAAAGLCLHRFDSLAGEYRALPPSEEGERAEVRFDQQ